MEGDGRLEREAADLGDAYQQGDEIILDPIHKEPLSFRGACDEESRTSAAIIIHFVLRRDPSLRSG
jgi:hypothetical protein